MAQIFRADRVRDSCVSGGLFALLKLTIAVLDPTLASSGGSVGHGTKTTILDE